MSPPTCTHPLPAPTRSESFYSGPHEAFLLPPSLTRGAGETRKTKSKREILRARERQMIREEDGRAPAAGKAMMLCKWAEGSFLIFTRSVNESLVRPSARARGLDLSSRVRCKRESARHNALARWWMRNRYRVITVSNAPIMHILLSVRSSYTWGEEACESCLAGVQRRRRNLITYNEYIHYVVISFIH